MRTIAVSRRALAMIAGAMVFTVAAAGSAVAQSDAGPTAAKSVTASATITQAITVTTTNLSFGEVAAGAVGEIQATDAGAGTIRITGGPGEDVDVDFTVPDELTGPAGQKLGIEWYGKYNTANDATTGQDLTVAPSMPTLSTALDGTDGTLFVFLGGKIEPPANQKRGLYTADLTVTVKYPGT
jgi:hypothetical protein